MCRTLRVSKNGYYSWIQCPEGMIFHSDRGVQYANKKMANVLASYKIRQSMSRKGNCWNNAVAESFFKSFKTEFVYGIKLKSKEEMSVCIFEYIEIWYNRKRKHSALEDLIIKEFWDLYMENKKLIKLIA